MVPTTPIGILGETLVVLQVLSTGLNHVRSVPLVFFGMVKVDFGLVDMCTCIPYLIKPKHGGVFLMDGLFYTHLLVFLDEFPPSRGLFT